MLDVLLATYDSAPYLQEQLDSLFLQDDQDFQILIRDGGSTDHTLEIIRANQQTHPGKITFLGSRKSGARENFSALLEASRADLVMFCDHDDVWFPLKISGTLKKYRELEELYGEKTPILVFTDACVTDQNLKIMDPSFFHYQNLNPRRLTLNRLLLQNVPSGNTMLINRPLIDLASPIPPEAFMHDHWLALAAAALGKIGVLEEPTLYYRQHGSNVCGASPYTFSGMAKKIRSGKESIRQRFILNIRQAVSFGRKYGKRLRPRDQEMLSQLEHWEEYDFLEKRKLLLKYRILKSGFIRNSGMLVLV